MTVKNRDQVIKNLSLLKVWGKYALDKGVLEWIQDAIELLEEDEKMFMKHYRQGRYDEAGLRNGTILQTHSSD